MRYKDSSLIKTPTKHKDVVMTEEDSEGEENLELG